MDVSGPGLPAPFSATSGTLFAYHKLDFKTILLCAFLYSSSRKSISALDLSTKAGISYKAAWLLIGKFRDALWLQRSLEPLQGDVEFDGGHCFNYVRPPNQHGGWFQPWQERMQGYKEFGIDEYGNPAWPEGHPAAQGQQPGGRILQPPRAVRDREARRVAGERAEQRVDDAIHADAANPARQLRMERERTRYNERRRVVIVMRERNPEGGGASRTIVEVCKTENHRDIAEMCRRYVAPGSMLHSDGVPFRALLREDGWDLEEVIHAQVYAALAEGPGVHINQSESFFARMRPVLEGSYTHHSPELLPLYVNEVAWREDTRRMTSGQIVFDLLSKCLGTAHSDYQGYYNGHRRYVANDGLFNYAA